MIEREIVEHTKVPWHLGDGLSDYSASIDIRGDKVWIGTVHGDHSTAESRPTSGFPSNDEGIANAAFIVQAVNAHDALVEALELSIEVMQYTAAYSGRSKDQRASVAVARIDIAQDALKLAKTTAHD